MAGRRGTGRSRSLDGARVRLVGVGAHRRLRRAGVVRHSCGWRHRTQSGSPSAGERPAAITKRASTPPSSCGPSRGTTWFDSRAVTRSSSVEGAKRPRSLPRRVFRSSSSPESPPPLAPRRPRASRSRTVSAPRALPSPLRMPRRRQRLGPRSRGTADGNGGPLHGTRSTRNVVRSPRSRGPKRGYTRGSDFTRDAPGRASARGNPCDHRHAGSARGHRSPRHPHGGRGGREAHRTRGFRSRKFNGPFLRDEACQADSLRECCAYCARLLQRSQRRQGFRDVVALPLRLVRAKAA